MNDNPRLPVPRNAPLPARRNSNVPALWQEAAPVVARGAALVAAGLIGEWLLRSFARSAFNAPRNGNGKPRKATALARHAEDAGPGTVTISETVIMTRRVIVRR